MIGAPPVLAGAVKVTLAWVSPAVAAPMVGAPGTTAFTVKVRVTVGAAFHTLLPAWSAAIVQEPAVTKVSAPPLVMVHTPVVNDVNVGARLEVAEAVDERLSVVPKFRAPGSGKVMVWLPLGVTELDGPDAALVPMALVAVTVKV